MKRICHEERKRDAAFHEFDGLTIFLWMQSKDNPGLNRSAQRISRLLLMLMASAVVLASCSRVQPAAAPSAEGSVEQRLAELEQRLNGDAPRLSEAEARKQWERDYAEIEQLGLVERAQTDFSSRLTNAIIESWSIGYIWNTNMVYCDVRYRLPGEGETLQKEFGYQRHGGTNWNLMWQAKAK